jgi:DNA repair protein RadC
MADSTSPQDPAPMEAPRERLWNHGTESLGTGEILSALLGSGCRGSGAVADLGHELLRSFGSLEAIARCPHEQLLRIPGMGRNKAAALKAAFEVARRLAIEARAASPILDSPESVARLLRGDWSTLEAERFVVLILTTRRRLIRVEQVSQGLLDSVLVHPREVFRPAIAWNAHAIILAHNHPGGDPNPSEADIRATRDLIRAGQLLRIEVLDHVILGRAIEGRPKDYCSLRELGCFYS